MLAMMLSFTACGGAEENLPAVSTAENFGESPYSHITNGGQYPGSQAAEKDEQERYPYGVDAITCATLTVEGPAMKESVPLPIGSMEAHETILARGLYSDKNGTYTYEGADLWQLLSTLGESEGIVPTDKAYRVIIKNSNRSQIASFTTEEVKAAHDAGRPILLAYGKGTKDGKKAAPFVFNGKDSSTHSEGYVKELKNDDGCLKLVYDLKAYGTENNEEFANAAYVYVCEESEPGFRHDKEGSPYAASGLKDYVVTFRGKTLGYEIDLTTAQLEALVKYDDKGNVAEGGLGYRRAYSLANNTYWYVNEYEGLKLYDLLCYLGMPDYDAMGTKAARTTLISFLASDGVISSEKFSVDALSYPDAFGFYNKNAADNNDGSYQSTNEDLVDTGYPVLLAYGFNNYPYVIGKKDEGFLSGLSNSGGPFRVVFGKTNYSHANGSNQVQYLSDVIVGDDCYYSTHKASGDPALAELAETPLPLALTAAGKNAGAPENFNVLALEDLIYGNGVTANSKKQAQVKRVCGSDIYEGVDLAYLIGSTLNVPYAADGEKMQGSVILSTASGDVTLDLADAASGKYAVVFAKNGTPLVKDASVPGYVKERALKPLLDSDPAVYPVDNAGGPAALLCGTELTAELTGIRVDLKQDAKQLAALRKTAEEEAIAAENAVPNEDIAWNHSMAPEYESYKNSVFEITISNNGNEWTRSFTVGELEQYTDCVYRGKYSVMEIGWCEGLDIWKLVKQICGYDPQAAGYVAAKNTEGVLCASSPVPGLDQATSLKLGAPDGYEIDLISTFLLSNVEQGITADDGRRLPMLLCYGIKGWALTDKNTDSAYVEEAGNCDGPLRIITEKSSQTSMKHCVKMTVKIPGEGALDMLPK